jgi:predicted proteasome-type protease
MTYCCSILARDGRAPTRIDSGDEYFCDLRERRSKALRAAHMPVPAPPDRGREP